MDHRSSPYFLNPVDPVRDDAPEYVRLVGTTAAHVSRYTSIIKKPMDLSTAQAKLDNGMYTDRQDFVADVRLIVHNCYTYNGSGTVVRKYGEAFEAFFDTRAYPASLCLLAHPVSTVWAKTETTLSSSAAHAVAISQRPVTDAIKSQAALPTLIEVPATAGPQKLKIKPPRSVNIDTIQSRLVPPMAPPPVPPGRKPSISITTFVQPPSSLAVSARHFADPEKSSKKRKESTRTINNIDDMLGEEVDAMERAQQADSFDELLEQAKSKKAKIPSGRSTSPQKATGSRSQLPPEPVESRHPNLGSAVKPAALQTPAKAPTSVPNAEVVPVATYEQPQPAVDLPPTVENAMPFKLRRSRNLIASLIKDPSSYLVRLNTSCLWSLMASSS